jgi:diketogulonate reductase-like aldo/keto reductase
MTDITWPEGLPLGPVTPQRIRANLAVFDFTLAAADMAALSAVGSGHDRLGPDPEIFSVI